jgi:hypothetical protein
MNLPPLSLPTSSSAFNRQFNSFSSGQVNLGATKAGLTGSGLTPVMALLILAGVLVYKRVV